MDPYKSGPDATNTPLFICCKFFRTRPYDIKINIQTGRAKNTVYCGLYTKIRTGTALTMLFSEIANLKQKLASIVPQIAVMASAVKHAVLLNCANFLYQHLCLLL